MIKGVVCVLEAWKDIYNNANEYIYGVMSPVPLDLIEPLVERINRGVKFSYIFGQDVVVPKERQNCCRNWDFRYKWYGSDIFDESMIKEI